MALFDKCYEFNKKVDYVKSLNQFFYLREIDPAATPVVTLSGKKMVMLGSNNYLGLTSHPKVVEATIKAIREYGTGACSSRILTGTTSLHTKLEKKLAKFKGTEDAVVFSTGFMTMMGTIASITEAGDIILSDEFNHASIVEGCRLSKALVKIYKHNNMASLEDKLSKCDPSVNKLIVTDGVFSMRGTVANLPEIKRLADKYEAKVMVDDAHGTGVLGAKGHGTLEYFGVEGEIDLVCGTFSKSLGTIGGFTGAKNEVVTFLKLNSRPFIFTASPPPSVVATVLACIEVIEEEPELLQKLRKNTDLMKKGLKETGFVLEETVTPIIPILINNDEMTFKMAGKLEEEGVFVNPVVPPAVPKGSSLIRVSIMASLSVEELEMALDKFRLAGKSLGVI
ncbi:8-amino-7-oxononanoate synthase [subsurface metagenome]